MKFSYSLIKKLLLSAPPLKILAAGLTAHAFEIEEAGGDLLDVKIPANRYSDAASHIGIAREAAAIFNLKFRNPVAEIVNLPAGQGSLRVKIDEPKLCPRYMGRYFELSHSTGSGQAGIGQSPAWMKKILKTCELKPINAVVDIMNYVMLETGQPMHAFDADKLSSSKLKAQNSKQIIVRKAKKDEKIETLDGQKFELDPEVLVIADANGPRKSASSQHESAVLAIAGIKGGMDSGVGAGTRRIIVEAANFDLANIFQTARRLKLPTDAALRFSHGLSPALAKIGMDRATALLRQTGAILKDSADIYPRPTGDQMIEFSPERFTGLIGAEIPRTQIKKYFEQLGFAVESVVKGGKRQVFLVRVPAWRNDIQTEEDLMEEAVRLYGLGRVAAASPLIGVRSAAEEDAIIFSDKVRDILADMQMDEVYNSTFLSQTDADRTQTNADESQRSSTFLAEVENPISEDKKYLRPSLLPLLLRNTEDNARYFDAVRIFEIGKIFRKNGASIEERLNLGLLLAAKKGERLVLELKGAVAELLKELGLIDARIFENNGVLRVESDHHVLGEIRTGKLEKNWAAAWAEIDAEELLGLAEGEKEFLPLSRYPAVERDISILVDKSVRIGPVLEAIQRAASFVDDADLIDEYSDEKLLARLSSGGGGERQSLTFRIVFQAEDRTLTDAEVDKEMSKITSVLRGKFNAVVR